MSPVETEEVNGFTIEYHYDQDAESPREFPGCSLVMRARGWDFPNDGEVDFSENIKDQLIELGALHIMPVYMLDHSGISLSVRDFADPWDSGQVGFAYVTRQNWEDTQGTPWTGSDENRAQAASLCEADVELYSQYVNGECFYVRVLDTDGEEMETFSVLGMEAAQEEARMEAEHMTHDPKCNGEINRRAGIIEHSQPCPLHP